MNSISKNVDRKAILDCFISTMLLLIFFTGIIGETKGQIIESPIIVEENNIDLINKYITDINMLANNGAIVQKSVINEAVVAELVEMEQVFSAPSSESVQTEIIVSDEEKWRSVTNCEPYTMFVNTSVGGSLNVRSEAVIGDNIVGGLYYGDQVTVVGHNTYDQSWYAIEYGDKIAFVSVEYIAENVDLSLRKDTVYENPEWDRVTTLNSRNGRIEGPSGQETYYNLPMDRCIYYMNQLGYDYEVWVRDDGVKMFGDYIMVAANLETRPKGSLVETSLGTGIVVDTGAFVEWNPNGVDIAVTW